jgi:hypothetical protein
MSLHGSHGEAPGPSDWFSFPQFGQIIVASSSFVAVREA